MIDAEVMVVAIDAHEAGGWHGGDDIEAQQPRVEALRLVGVPDPQVHVPQGRAAGHRRRVPSGRGRPGRNRIHDRLQVKRQGRYRHAVTVPGPRIAGSVGVDLQPVAVRVIEVERLADTVVGRPERVPRLGQPEDHPSQRRSIREQDRGMEEAGDIPGKRRDAGPDREPEDGARSRPECDQKTVASGRLVEDAKSEHVPVEGKRSSPVRHGQGGGPETKPWRETVRTVRPGRW